MPSRTIATALVLAAAACVGSRPGSEPSHGALVEPDVFDVIRAGNSKAAVEQLRDRYQEEVQHARLLEARIGELIAAEEGLSLEHRERLVALQSIRDEVRKLADEQERLAQQIETIRKSNAELEAALAAEEARQEEVRKAAGAARGGD